jgi:hypothetical protein
MLTASFLYAGYSDYFSGHGCADDAEHSEHLLYAFYGKDTTLHDIINQLVEDSWSGPASETLPEEVTTNDVRSALLDMLSSVGLADYVSCALAECAADLVSACDDDDDDDDNEDDEDDCESPIFIVKLDYEKPEEEVDVTNCAGYDKQTGCTKCSSYDDCDDRE